VSRRIGPSVVRAGLVACVVSVSLAGCDAGSSSAVPPLTTSFHSSVSTTSKPVEVSAGPLPSYRSMWADLVSAARTSDFQSTRLSLHATGQALTLFVQGLARDRLHGIVTRGELGLHPVVSSLSPNRDPTGATIVDCFDDTHWLEYQTSGGLAKNTPGGRRATTAELVKNSGTWKVTQLTVGKTGTC
jgi:hypothetical protein